jgi:hypothetical protein
MTPSEKVAKFITDNFENVTVEDFPLLPYGKRIIDKDGGEMIVCYEIMAQEVRVIVPEEGSEKDEQI